EGMWARLTPGRADGVRMSSMVGGWLVPSSLQIVGWMHGTRLHTASTSGRVQRIWYMFAVGPPRSLIVPLKPGSVAIFFASARTERELRLWMIRPSCIVIEQNVQPPKQQPRMICTESLIIVCAGICS